MHAGPSSHSHTYTPAGTTLSLQGSSRIYAITRLVTFLVTRLVTLGHTPCHTPGHTWSHIRGHTWSHTPDHTWLHSYGHTWSHLITLARSNLTTPGHTHLVTLDHTWSHLVTPGHTNTPVPAGLLNRKYDDVVQVVFDRFWVDRGVAALREDVPKGESESGLWGSRVLGGQGCILPSHVGLYCLVMWASAA